MNNWVIGFDEKNIFRDQKNELLPEIKTFVEKSRKGNEKYILVTDPPCRY